VIELPGIPFVDLAAHHAPIREELDRAIDAVIDASQFVRGPAVAEFESAFAAYCQSENCVGVGNGTDALELAIDALGLPRGAEVITTPTTFVATAEAIVRTGFRPRLVDVDPDTWQLDPRALRGGLGSDVGAVIAVHLYGTPAPMVEIDRVLEGSGVACIEDAAQAHGAAYAGRRVGSLGRVAAFSFYPGKNLGAFGDAGAVVTADAELAERVRRLGDHGRAGRHRHEVVGRNSRLDTMQAAVLLVKLARLDEANARRRAIAARYRSGLDDVPEVDLPVEDQDATSVHHLFAVGCDVRDALSEHLRGEGIATGMHYPVPVHLQPAFRDLGYSRGDFPHAERIADRTLSLPMYPELPDGAVERVCDTIRKYFGAH